MKIAVVRWAILIKDRNLPAADAVEASGLNCHEIDRKPREGASIRLVWQDDSVAALWPNRRREKEVETWL